MTDEHWPHELVGTLNAVQQIREKCDRTEVRSVPDLGPRSADLRPRGRNGAEGSAM
jgi:hypothetical protein